MVPLLSLSLPRYSVEKSIGSAWLPGILFLGFFGDDCLGAGC